MAAIPQCEDRAGAEPGTIRVADYLAAEESAELRSEYLGGLVYAMSGASVRHNRIVGNTFAALRSRVPAGCEVFFESVKLHLRLQGLDWFYYPDAMICCDPADDHPLYRERPCLLVEVLSESTARIDRREKYLVYTQTPGLRGYLLLDQELCVRSCIVATPPVSGSNRPSIPPPPCSTCPASVPSPLANSTPASISADPALLPSFPLVLSR